MRHPVVAILIGEMSSDGKRGWVLMLITSITGIGLEAKKEKEASMVTSISRLSKLDHTQSIKATQIGSNSI
jgi:hypothetical protein